MTKTVLGDRVVQPDLGLAQAEAVRTPSADASARMAMASWPVVLNSRSPGRPITSDFTGSSTCSAETHWRAPISTCPARYRT